jgi:hypothetical protein
VFGEVNSAFFWCGGAVVKLRRDYFNYGKTAPLAGFIWVRVMRKCGSLLLLLQKRLRWDVTETTSNNVFIRRRLDIAEPRMRPLAYIAATGWKWVTFATSSFVPKDMSKLFHTTELGK